MIQLMYLLYYNCAMISFAIALGFVNGARNYGKLGNLLANIAFLNGIITSAVLFFHYYYRQGDSSSKVHLILNLCCFIIPFCQYVITLEISRFVQQLFQFRQLKLVKRLHYFAIFLSIAGMLSIVFNAFWGYYYHIDSQNQFCVGPYFPVSTILYGLTFLANSYQIFRYRRQFPSFEQAGFFSLVLLPLISILFSLRYPNFSSLAVTITISIIIMSYCYNVYNRRLLEEQNRQLLVTRSHLLNSQIQPHFIFNALNTIQALIDIDPEEASDTIRHFSGYLRQTLGNTRDDGLNSFQSEIEHARNYLYIEQKRFGDKLKIIYDFDPRLDFLLPYLSIEPLVENAVRHGIRGKLGGGSITILARSRERDYLVQVLDDGIGFQEKEVDYTTRVGLQNVVQRIELLCHGSMKIQSEPGKGAQVTICIPKNVIPGQISKTT